MESKQSSPKTGWLVAASVLISLLLLPLVVGRLFWDTSLIEKMFNRYTMRWVSGLGFVIAQPLGWVNAILGSKILSRRPGTTSRVIALIGFVLGVLGILTGLIWAVIALIPY
jgi:hypothetical protein